MRIAFIGNCQVQTLAMLAMEMLDGPEVMLLDYSGPAMHDVAMRRDFADRLAGCDLIFAQTAQLSHTNERELRPRFGDRLVTIANFYFRGLFPDSCYVGSFAHRLTQPTAVQSVIVLDAFLRGLSEPQACHAFNEDNYLRLGLFDAWRSSMDEMRRREANHAVDVPAAALMEQACLTWPAFLTMNHPGAMLLAAYLSQVFRHASLRHRRVSALRLPDPLAEHDTTPVLDAVAEHHRLPYRTAQRWKINLLTSSGRNLTLAGYVGALYTAYRQRNRAECVVHSPTDLVAALRRAPGLGGLVEPPVGERTAGPGRDSAAAAG